MTRRPELDKTGPVSILKSEEARSLTQQNSADDIEMLYGIQSNADVSNQNVSVTSKTSAADAYEDTSGIATFQSPRYVVISRHSEPQSSRNEQSVQEEEEIEGNEIVVFDQSCVKKKDGMSPS